MVELLNEMKPELKIIKDAKKDYMKKGKLGSVLYPKYNAKLKLDKKEIELRIHDKKFGGITYTEINFDELSKTPKNRIEYGEDMVAQNGDLIIFRYKIIGKENRVITSISIIGKDDVAVKKKQVKKK